MQSIPLAVLKLLNPKTTLSLVSRLHAIHTACGIETNDEARTTDFLTDCMQSIPLAVLKLEFHIRDVSCVAKLHAIHTACGVEKGKVCAENP